LEPSYDFSTPEDVLIEVVAKEDGYCWISTTSVINGADGTMGAASYESSYGFIEFTIEEMIDYPGIGWFVVEGVTADYLKGDGWSTDDDMRFYYTNIRPATPEEIALA